MSSRPAGWASHLRDAALALYPLGLVLLTLLALAAPQRTGALALAQVFAPALFASMLLLAPLALLPSMFLLRLALATATATFLLVYPPALNLASSRPPAAPTLTVMSWNVFAGGVALSDLHAAIETHDPDLVLLQELHWDIVADDSVLLARYPYQLLRPEETAHGLAILSRRPIRESAVPYFKDSQLEIRRAVWARIEVEGRLITVVNAHPLAPRTFTEDCGPLRCYNTGPRDAQISALRALLEELHFATGDPLLLGGDMNVTEREPAYFELAAGLRDAHRSVGRGFGASWRPSLLDLPAGLLRIDYLFSDAQLRPLTLTTDCTPRGSDHCLLVGRFALEG
jgi:vancomycin resistance protein VanJ